ESSPGSFTTISFPIPLEEKSEKAFLFNAEETQFEEFGKDAGQSCVVGEPECVPTGCEGTIEDPTAAPGVLCIYTTEEIAEEHTSGRLRPRQLIGGALGYSKSGALLNGLFIQGTTENPAIYEAHGSWAVEAPPAS